MDDFKKVVERIITGEFIMERIQMAVKRIISDEFIMERIATSPSLQNSLASAMKSEYVSRKDVEADVAMWATPIIETTTGDLLLHMIWQEPRSYDEPHFFSSGDYDTVLQALPSLTGKDLGSLRMLCDRVITGRHYNFYSMDFRGVKAKALECLELFERHKCLQYSLPDQYYVLMNLESFKFWRSPASRVNRYYAYDF